MCLLFITNLSQHIHTMVRLVSHSHNVFQLVLLGHFISRNSLPYCEHDPSYHQISQSNFVKAFFVLHGEVLTGLKHSFKKQLPKVSDKKNCSTKFSNVNRKTLVLEPLFNNLFLFITKRLEHRCFPVNIAKLLKTSILKDICERLLLNFIDSKKE